MGVPFVHKAYDSPPPRYFLVSCAGRYHSQVNKGTFHACMHSCVVQTAVFKRVHYSAHHTAHLNAGAANTGVLAAAGAGAARHTDGPALPGRLDCLPRSARATATSRYLRRRTSDPGRTSPHASCNNNSTSQQTAVATAATTAAVAVAAAQQQQQQQQQ
jgi:hypothetical protein